jgi:hypothetical protein
VGSSYIGVVGVIRKNNENKKEGREYFFKKAKSVTELLEGPQSFKRYKYLYTTGSM